MKNSKIENSLYQFGNEVALDFRILDRNDKNICSSFRCLNSHIDEFVRKISYKHVDIVTYAAIDINNGKIVSIFSIQCTGIYTKHGFPSKRKDIVIPAIEIVYFATDYRYQKISYSSDYHEDTLSFQIFCVFLSKLVGISKNVIGAQKIVLYSVPDAVSFYKKCNFKDFKPYMVKDENQKLINCTPMFFSLKQ